MTPLPWPQFRGQGTSKIGDAMYLLKSIALVGIAIGLWITAPILIALGGTVATILIIRYMLKEYADAEKNQENHF